jgi:hypothetical protein
MDDKLQESFTVIRVAGQETSLPPANSDDGPLSNSLEDLILKNSDEEVGMEKTNHLESEGRRVAKEGEVDVDGRSGYRIGEDNW